MRHRGNSLLEYGTPLAVFLLAGTIIATLGELPERFQQFMAGTMNADIVGETLEVSPLGHSGSIRAGSTQTIVLPDGQVISVYDNAELAKTVETSGANGTTRMLMNDLIALAEQMQASGEISAGQASILKQLANQGHFIAEAEAVLEQAAAQANGDAAAFAGMAISFKGKTYTTESLANYIGYDTSTTGSAGFMNDPLNGPINDGKTNYLRDFRNLFNEAVRSGALNNPETRATITALSEDVLRLAGQVEYQVDRIGEGGESPDSLRQNMASDLTHDDSQDICHTGGHNDTGKNCS